MKDLKVLQVIDILNVGGAERVFVDLTNLLHESNVSVSALFLLEGGILLNELNPQIDRIELKRVNKFNLISFFKAANVIKDFQIVHCHSRHVYRYIKLVQRLFFIKTKVVFQDHYGGICIDKKIPFLFNSLLKPKYYIGVSQELNEWASRSLKIKNQNIFLLENIVRKKNFNAGKNHIRTEIVLVSNIKASKNQLFILNILKELPTSLTFIGAIQDVNYYSKLVVKSKQMENIRFLTNIDNIQRELKCYRLGLHTSHSETGPLVLIEYLAQGLPFLAFDTGEVARILKPHFPQYFINNFNPLEWRERISCLLKESPNRLKMAEVFEKHFGSNHYIEKCLKIYENINN